MIPRQQLSVSSWVYAMLLLLVLVSTTQTVTVTAQSLVDCITAMMNHDVDGDDALSYAEYLNLLVALTSTPSSTSHSNAATAAATTTAPASCGSNVATLILDHATSFQSDFAKLACHCTDFYNEAVASSTSSSNVDSGPPPCTCPEDSEATSTTGTSDIFNNESSPDDTTAPTPTIALPGVYPGAYAVRVCDDITTQLLLLQADCLNVPPIYTPLTASPSVAVVTTTTTASPTSSPMAAIVAAAPTTTTAPRVTISPAALSIPANPSSTIAPTPFKSVKLPTVSNVIVPSPSVAVAILQGDDLPTAAPMSDIVSDSVRVDDPYVPTATSTNRNVAPSSTATTTAESDNGFITERDRNGLAIALPILIVASCAVAGLLANHHRQKDQSGNVSNGPPRGSIKLSDSKDYDLEHGGGGGIADDQMDGYAKDIKSYSKSRTHHIALGNNSRDEEDIEVTEVSETAHDDSEVEHLFRDDDDDEDESIDLREAAFNLNNAGAASTAARPHLNLVLPTSDIETSHADTNSNNNNHASNATTPSPVSRSGGGATGDSSNISGIIGELGIVTLTSSMSHLETVQASLTASMSRLDTPPKQEEHGDEQQPVAPDVAVDQNKNVQSKIQPRLPILPSPKEQSATTSSKRKKKKKNKPPQSVLMQTVDAVRKEHSRPTDHGSDAQSTGTSSRSLATGLASSGSGDNLLPSLSNHSSSTGSSLNIFDDNTSTSSSDPIHHLEHATISTSSKSSGGGTPPKRIPRLPPSSSTPPSNISSFLTATIQQNSPLLHTLSASSSSPTSSSSTSELVPFMPTKIKLRSSSRDRLGLAMTGSDGSPTATTDGGTTTAMTSAASEWDWKQSPPQPASTTDTTTSSLAMVTTDRNKRVAAFHDDEDETIDTTNSASTVGETPIPATTSSGSDAIIVHAGTAIVAHSPGTAKTGQQQLPGEDKGLYFQ